MKIGTKWKRREVNYENVFLHKWKQGIGRLKFARLPPHILARFLAVICALRVIMIIEYGKNKSNNNENKK